MKGAPSRTSRAVLAMLAMTAGAFAGACGSKSIDEHPCPPAGTKLTYTNFGEGFFANYCVRCHGGANGYSSRSFATVDAIRANRERVFVNSADDNTTMPPGPDDPPESERQKLGEWLACGAP